MRPIEQQLEQRFPRWFRGRRAVLARPVLRTLGRWSRLDEIAAFLADSGHLRDFAFVREPEGNGCVERFIRTLKENLLWVRHFETIEELRLALLDFAAWYNTHWLVARHGHRTPAQVRADQQLAMDRAA